jgi:antitoxin PrlF
MKPWERGRRLTVCYITISQGNAEVTAILLIFCEMAVVGCPRLSEHSRRLFTRPASGDNTCCKASRLPKHEVGAALNESDIDRDPRPRTSARARLRPKAQLTLPDEIRRALHVNEGDEIEFAVHENGTITVRGYVSVPSDQAWWFTANRPGNARPVDAGTTHASAEAMFAYLDALGAAQLIQPLATEAASRRFRPVAR